MLQALQVWSEQQAHALAAPAWRLRLMATARPPLIAQAAAPEAHGHHATRRTRTMAARGTSRPATGTPGPRDPWAGQNVMNVILVGAECAPWSKTGKPPWLTSPSLPQLPAREWLSCSGCVWHPLASPLGA